MTRYGQLGQHFLVIGRIDELDLAILADPDARLWRLDLAAAYALPRFDKVIHWNCTTCNLASTV
jgi:hypothetical protein